MLNGQLSTGLVQVVAPGTGEVLGYAYTVPNGGGQLQRWLLYRNPQNTFDVVAPPAEMARWTLADWKANVPSLWRPDAYYVWAQADTYEYGRTYRHEYDGGHYETQWDQIPADLPAANYPSEGSRYQLDPTGWNVINVLQWASNLWGMAWAEDGLRDAAAAPTGRARNREYWFLPAGFQPAGGDRRTSVAVGTLEAGSLDRFVDLARQRWAPGAVLTITGCCNYFNAEPPAMP